MTIRMVYPGGDKQNTLAATSPAVAQNDKKEVSGRQGKLNASAAPNGQERRKRTRTRMSLSARLRPVDPKDGNFEQFVRTLNSSRDGLYFSVPKAQLFAQMRLRVIFPYTSAHDSVLVLEEYGQITRVDHLPDGSLGIAIVLQGSGDPERLSVEATADCRPEENEERRVIARHSFSATATVRHAQSGARVTARCSDLSLSGCYVDTINPFSEKARVQLRLSLGNENIETAARVVFRQVNIGMGLVFCDLTPDQELILMQWLDGGTGEAEPGPIQGSHKTAAPEAPALTDQALALRLIHLLRSKGNLREADVSILLSKYLATDDEVASRPCSDRL